MAKVSITRWGVYAAFAAAVVLVAALAIQNRRLQTRYTALVEHATSPQAGYRAPWVPARTLAGDTVVLGAPDPGRVQVLFFYTTTCPHCRATAPAWNQIASRASGAVVLGVQLDSVHRAARYRDSMQLGYQVIPVDSALARRVTDWYRVRGVPLTLVIGPDGRVSYSRLGRLEASSVVDSVLAAVRMTGGRS